MAAIQKFWRQFSQWFLNLHSIDVLIVVVGVILALLLRFSLRSYITFDAGIITHWYRAIHKEGFTAIKDGISNYPPLYLYMLYIISIILPKIWDILAIKLPAILFDFICAWLVYKIVRLRFSEGPLPIFAFFAILFAPTVVLNSALWGQIDMLYSAALIASVFFLLKQKSLLACLAFGIAISFKFQAVFIFPFLLLMVVKKKVPWWELFIIPFVYLITILPVWIAGRSLWDLLTIYVSQVEFSQLLVRSAPNLYTWLPNEQYAVFYPAGLILAASVVLLYLVLGYKSKAKITGAVMIQLALSSALLMPFFLPKMHERYFFTAEVLAIVYAFYFPDHFYVPIITSFISLLTYVLVLFNTEIIPIQYLALAMLAVLVVVVRKLILTLYAPPQPAEELITQRI